MDKNPAFPFNMYEGDVPANEILSPHVLEAKINTK